MLLTCVISVYDYWTVWDCAVWKRANRAIQPLSSIPHHAFLHPRSLAIFARHCSVTFRYFRLVYASVNHSPPHFFCFFPKPLFPICCSLLPLASLFTPPPASPTLLLQYVTSVVVSWRNGSSANLPVTLRSQIAMNPCVRHTLVVARGHTEFISRLPELFRPRGVSYHKLYPHPDIKHQPQR